MPVIVKQIGGKWRVVEAHTEAIATHGEGGGVADGGGHDTQEKAQAQANAINASLTGEAHKRARRHGNRR